MTNANYPLAKEITDALNEFAPPGFAMDGDVIGLQVGRLDKPVTQVMLALEPSPTVVDLAIQRNVDLLLTHHAMLFRAIHSIDTSSARGLAITKALTHGLTIFNAHTNLDVAKGGVNDVLAEIFHLQDIAVLQTLGRNELRKLVVFVPETHQETVRDAICTAGAGHIGAYSHCTFNAHGVGTFLPLDGATPFLGEVGRLERATEVRVETIVPQSILSEVTRAMLAAHPYEEVAYDVYPLDLLGEPYGIGRIGTLPQSTSLHEFAIEVRNTLGLRHLRYGGAPDHPVTRVAVAGGSGGDLVETALAMSADVLVTSDCKHHLVAEAWQDGLAIIDATHAATERPVLAVVGKYMRDRFPQVTFEIADIDEDPFVWV